MNYLFVKIFFRIYFDFLSGTNNDAKILTLKIPKIIIKE